jgi:uncharacterized protein YbaR (Trm112 family)
MDRRLAQILVCPVCLSDFLYIEKENILKCINNLCAVEYSIVNDIPNLLVDEAKTDCPSCKEKRIWNPLEKTLYCQKCNKIVTRPAQNGKS